METHFCESAIVIADDRKRSQKIEECSIFYDRLRLSAITWKQFSIRSSAIRDRLRSYGNQALVVDNPILSEVRQSSIQDTRGQTSVLFSTLIHAY